MKLFRKLWLILYIFIAGCASVSSPTGGKKDIKPPKLLNAYPKDKSINFNGQTMEIEFDEYVKIENLKQELLITPALNGDYQTKLTKTGIRLNFDKPFAPNTTYTFNFRNAFKDITEKNIAKKIKLVFSTGNVIDTLSMVGNITDPLKNMPLLDVLVSLYLANDTLKVEKHKPYYSTRTDSAGNFALENLKEGNYRIYGVEDKNNNLKYDAFSERVGFLPGPIQLSENVKDIKLRMVKIDKAPPRITGNDAKENTYTIEFNEGIIDLKVGFPNSIPSLPYMIDGNNKLMLFKQTEIQDSIPIQINAIDSSGNNLNKDIKIKFAIAKDKTARQSEKNTVKKELSLNIKPKNGEEVLKSFDFQINFGKPIKFDKLDNIRALADTINDITLTKDSFRWDKYRTALSIRIESRASREIGIRIPAGTFISVENDTNKIVRQDHKLMEIENYGSISGNITTDATHFIIELLSSDFKVVDRKLNIKDFKFNFLSAGTYRVRVIRDTNQNGEWDRGDLEEGILPEEIAFSPDEIKLKQNWDITDINITL
jgi:uncharacterized protein (DUF2141 family)